MNRSSGILLHISSLPGPYGIGDVGPDARAWIDQMARAGQRWWQILPLTPPGDGNSPYNSVSAFAGNILLISPDGLQRDGLIADASIYKATQPGERVSFPTVIRRKRRLLEEAWARFNSRRPKDIRRDFQRFADEQASWLYDHALFTALTGVMGTADWTQWPSELMRRKPLAAREAAQRLGDAIDRERFSQYLFFRQWHGLREYAAERGVKIIGDLPIFVSAQSADVWAHPELFLLDRRYKPKVVAGVPPDAFAADGQRWGNPLYNWKAMERDDFRWWVQRMCCALAQADVVRIDHFRGLESYWSIPQESRSAKHGKWVRAPGFQLIETLRRKLGSLPVIAEDLGFITPQVEALRDRFNLPGMRVLQFGFEDDDFHLPHRFIHNCVAYTGTHDNNTTAGWFSSSSKATRQRVRVLAPAIKNNRDAAWELIRMAWSSVADLAIAPMQDVLALGSAARMNRPGTTAGNWRWRMRSLDAARKPMERLANLTAIYSRDAG